MRPYLRSCAAAGFLAAVSVPAAAERIDTEDLRNLPPADVVILGELHDNPAHHVNQAAAVAAIGAKALVFEMLTDEQARRITPALLKSATELERALGWTEAGWPPFAMYYPIFVAVEGAAIFGGALDRDVVRRAVSEGAAEVMGGSAELFGLDVPLDDGEQVMREAGQMEAHCDALPEDMLSGMVEAQRLRDANTQTFCSAVDRGTCRDRRTGGGDHRQRPRARRLGDSACAGSCRAGTAGSDPGAVRKPARRGIAIRFLAGDRTGRARGPLRGPDRPLMRRPIVLGPLPA